MNIFRCIARFCQKLPEPDSTQKGKMVACLLENVFDPVLADIMLKFLELCFDVDDVTASPTSADPAKFSRLLKCIQRAKHVRCEMDCSREIVDMFLLNEHHFDDVSMRMHSSWWSDQSPNLVKEADLLIERIIVHSEGNQNEILDMMHSTVQGMEDIK